MSERMGGRLVRGRSKNEADSIVILSEGAQHRSRRIPLCHFKRFFDYALARSLKNDKPNPGRVPVPLSGFGPLAAVACALALSCALAGCAASGTTPGDGATTSAATPPANVAPRSSEEIEAALERIQVDASYIDECTATWRANAQAAAQMTDEEIHARAQEIADTLTTSQKISQLMLVRCPDVAPAKKMYDGSFGGYVLYAQDFYNDEEALSQDEVKERIGSFVRAAEEACGIAPLIAVDEEGGTVVRASYNENLFPEGPVPAPQETLRDKGAEALYDQVRSVGATLAEYGINVNLAPVVDLPTEENSMMYDRSLGTNAETAADLTAGMVAAMHEAPIAATLKHFPGYGDADDSHSLQATDNRSLEDLQAYDFLPFKAGIEAGADAIMVSHVVTEGIDPSLPASLSPETYRILREDLGFTGVVITDDLWMIDETYYDIKSTEAAPLAISAGCDIIISTQYELDHAAVMQAILDDELSQGRIDEAVEHVLAWKLKLGLIS